MPAEDGLSNSQRVACPRSTSIQTTSWTEVYHSDPSCDILELTLNCDLFESDG